MANIIIKASDADVQKAVREAQEEKDEKHARNVFANERRTGDPLGSLEYVQWPSDPYGFDHATKVQQLSAHILGSFPDMKDRDFYIMRAVGLMHDLGRAEDWRRPDPQHNHRSAVIAADLMRKDSTWWSKKELHAEICQLIATHSLRPAGEDGSKWRPPTDPRLIALHDAECFESSRLSVKTVEGLNVMKLRYDQVISEWAKNIEHQRRWRTSRGW